MAFDDPFTPVDYSINPMAGGGMSRRPYYVDPNAPSVIDNTSEFGRAVRSAVLNTKAGYTQALPGLARQLVGDQEGALRNYAEFQRQSEQAAALGPRIQDLDQVENASDAALWAMNMAVATAPDIATSLTGSGLGATAGRRIALGTAKGMARRQIERSLAEQGMAKVRNRKIADTVVRNAVQAGDSRVAQAQLDDAVGAVARRIGGRAGRKGIERTSHAGSVLGSGAGQYPGLLQDSVDALQQTDQTGAASILGTDAVAAFLGGLPIDRLTGRILGRGIQQIPGAREAAAKNFREYLPKALRNVATETLLQGGAEGTMGVVQAAVQLAGHDYVLGNVDLLGPEAQRRYLAEFVGGVLLGGALGGTVEGARMAPEGAGLALDAVVPNRESLRDAIRGRLQGMADKARARNEASARYAPGEEMGPGAPGPGTGDPGSPTGGVAGVFHAGMDAAQQAAAKAGRTINSVYDRIRRQKEQTVEDHESDEAADRASELLDAIQQGNETLEDGSPVPYPLRATNQGPQASLPTPLQRLLMAYVPVDSPIWADPDAAKAMASVLEDSVTGRLEGTDVDKEAARTAREFFPPNALDLFDAYAMAYKDLFAQLSSEPDGGRAGIRDVTPDSPTERAAGQLAGQGRRANEIIKAHYAQLKKDNPNATHEELSERTRAFARSLTPEQLADPSFVDETLALTEEEAARRQAAEDEVALAELAESDGLKLDAGEEAGHVGGFSTEAAAEGSPHERLLTARQDMIALRRQIDEASARGEDTRELRKERKRVGQLRHRLVKQVRQDVLGHKALGGVFDGGSENAVLTESAQRRKFFADRLDSPSTILMRETYTSGGKTLRKALDLGSMASHVQGSRNISDIKSAMLEGLAELLDVGVKLDMSTLKAGDVTTEKTGKVLFTLTEADVRGLKQAAKRYDMPEAQSAGRGKRLPDAPRGTPQPRNVKGEPMEPSARPIRPKRRAVDESVGEVGVTGIRDPAIREKLHGAGVSHTPDAQHERVSFDQVMVGTEIDPDTVKQGEREAPPQGATEAGIFTPTTAAVSGVDFRDPYNKVTSTLMNNEAIKHPRWRRVAQIKLGMRVALEQLGRQYTNGELSNQQYANAMRAVFGPNWEKASDNFDADTLKLDNDMVVETMVNVPDLTQAKKPKPSERIEKTKEPDFRGGNEYQKALHWFYRAWKGEFTSHSSVRTMQTDDAALKQRESTAERATDVIKNVAVEAINFARSIDQSPEAKKYRKYEQIRQEDKHLTRAAYREYLALRKEYGPTEAKYLSDDVLVEFVEQIKPLPAPSDRVDAQGKPLPDAPPRRDARSRAIDTIRAYVAATREETKAGNNRAAALLAKMSPAVKKRALQQRLLQSVVDNLDALHPDNPIIDALPTTESAVDEASVRESRRRNKAAKNIGRAAVGSKAKTKADKKRARAKHVERLAAAELEAREAPIKDLGVPSSRTTGEEIAAETRKFRPEPQGVDLTTEEGQAQYKATLEQHAERLDIERAIKNNQRSDGTTDTVGVLRDLLVPANEPRTKAMLPEERAAYDAAVAEHIAAVAERAAGTLLATSGRALGEGNRLRGAQILDRAHQLAQQQTIAEMKAKREALKAVPKKTKAQIDAYREAGEILRAAEGRLKRVEARIERNEAKGATGRKNRIGEALSELAKQEMALVRHNALRAQYEAQMGPLVSPGKATEAKPAPAPKPKREEKSGWTDEAKAHLLQSKENKLAPTPDRKNIADDRKTERERIRKNTAAVARANTKDSAAETKSTQKEPARKVEDRLRALEKEERRFYDLREANQQQGTNHDLSFWTAEKRREKRELKERLERVDDKGLADKDVGEQVSDIANNKGPHDFKAETDMLNALLKEMGIKERVEVRSYGDKRRNQTGDRGAGNTQRRASYHGRSDHGIIYISDLLTLGERIDVLAHELGHHIIRSEIARASGGKLKFSDMRFYDLMDSIEKLREHNEPLYDALKTDFDAWVAKHPASQLTHEQVRATRAPFFRGRNLVLREKARYARKGKTPPKASESGDLTYLYSMEEWFADNIARALTTNEQAQGIVGKFFKDIADALRKMYNAFFGTAEGKKWAPAPSVDEWVKQLFSRERAAVAEQLGSTPSHAQVEAAVESAVVSQLLALPPPETRPSRTPPERPDVIHSGHDKQPGKNVIHVSGDPVRDLGPNSFAAMMRYVRDFFTPEATQVLMKALNRKVPLQRLKEIYKDNERALRLMDSASHGMEARIAAAYLAWKQGQFVTGPQGRSAFLGADEGLAAIFNVAANGDMAERIFADVSAGVVKRFKELDKTYSPREREARRRGRMQELANSAHKISEAIHKPWSRFIESKTQRAFDSGIPAWRWIAGQLYRPPGTTGPDRGMLREIAYAGTKWTSRAKAALGDLSPLETRRVIQAFQERRPFTTRAKTDTGPKSTSADAARTAERAVAMKKAHTELQRLFKDMHAYLESRGVKLGKVENFFPVVMDLVNDTQAQTLRTLLEKSKYRSKLLELMDKLSEQGDEAKASEGKDIPPIPPEVLSFFAERRAKKMSPKQATTNQSILDALTSADIPAIKGHIYTAKNRRAEHAHRPVLARTIDIEIKYMEARIQQLKDAGFSDAAPAKKPKTKKSFEGTEDERIAAFIDDLVKGAGRPTFDTAAFVGNIGAPNFKAANYRLMGFIYDINEKARAAAEASGDAAAVAEANADIKTFASLQSKDMARILERYVMGAVHRAEFAYRFGDDGAKLEAKLKEMEKQGATPVQIQDARNMVDAAIGRYGANGSPTIGALFPDLAQRLSGPKARAVVDGLLAYQNARVLPLALLSSLVDPLGIGIRSGGDMGVAWAGLKAGLKSITSKTERADLVNWMREVGMPDDGDAMQILNQEYGGADNVLARRANEMVFKLNGLTWFTQVTRGMAVRSAHQFLLKHMDGKSKASKEYLREMNLEVGDVTRTVDGQGRTKVKLMTAEERLKAAPADVARDNRVRRALQQFADEAVQRPNSQQLPQWHSDPYMKLVAQYKAFVYSMYDQIVGRIALEMGKGNLKVLLPALAYLPVMLMAELMREFIQWGTDGNPQRANWGVTEYTHLAATRTGLFSPKVEFYGDAHDDMQRGNLPGVSSLGPTSGQVRRLLDGKQWSQDFEDALPASSLWKRRINPTTWFRGEAQA